MKSVVIKVFRNSFHLSPRYYERCKFYSSTIDREDLIQMLEKKIYDMDKRERLDSVRDGSLENKQKTLNVNQIPVFDVVKDYENVENKKKLCKVISDTGICSRREAERLIKEGRVSVGSDTIKFPFASVDSNLWSSLQIDGVRLRSKYLQPIPRIWVTSKQTNELLISDSTLKGRDTLINRLSKSLSKSQAALLRSLKPIFHLDYNVEGMSFFTDNSEMARLLTSPSSNIPKVYKIRVHGKLTNNKINSLKRGIHLNGVKYNPLEIKLVSTNSTNSWVEVYTTGNRIDNIKKSLEALYLKVNRIICIGFGPYRFAEVFKENETLSTKEEKSQAALLKELKLSPKLNSMYLKYLNMKLMPK